MREALVSFPLFGRCAEMYNRFNDTGLFSNILFTKRISRKKEFYVLINILTLKQNILRENFLIHQGQRNKQ